MTRVLDVGIVMDGRSLQDIQEIEDKIRDHVDGIDQSSGTGLGFRDFQIELSEQSPDEETISKFCNDLLNKDDDYFGIYDDDEE